MTTPITGETWGDEIDRVRDHLLKEAQQPFAILRSEYESARRDFLTAIDGVSESQAAFRPGTGEGEEAWGIAEALRHIASIETIMADRLRLLGSGRPAGVKATYPGFMEDVETRRLPELVDALDASSSSLLTAIAAIEGHERLDTLAAHRRFGDLNCRGWLAMHCLHLQDHARQINKIKAMAGYPPA
ncbi:MAG: hypothetical protein GEU75_06220 [Dehalococcoidia bacterium]|nr:hypothetical protein [Dehalococcoidia bacterium]